MGELKSKGGLQLVLEAPEIVCKGVFFFFFFFTNEVRGETEPEKKRHRQKDIEGDRGRMNVHS